MRVSKMRKAKYLFLMILAILLSGLLLACSAGPESTVIDFYNALEEGDGEAALEYVSEDMRKIHRLQVEFMALVFEELNDEGESYWEIKGSEYEQGTAKVEVVDNVVGFGDDRSFYISLVEEEGQWLIQDLWHD